MSKSIALVFHENERNRDIPSFAIWHLAQIWRNDGVRVHYLFGVKKHIPADLAILHVDLTAVPKEYTDFAKRYPIALNGNLRNISKSLISQNRINPKDGYEGRVIVKSELNFAGRPERKLLGTPLSRKAFRIACRLPFDPLQILGPRPRFKSPTDYIIRENIQSVPRVWFDRKDLLIERFLPEKQDGLYCLRIYHFLGNRGVCILWKSGNPVVNSSTVIKRQKVEVHPEIVSLTKSMGFDYGKFDYVMHDDKPVLLDANKTPGAVDTAAYRDMCSEWAKGIRAYL